MRNKAITYAASLLLLATVGAIAYVLKEGSLDDAASWAQLIALLVALIPYLAWLRPKSESAIADTGESVARARRALATAVSRQWREEILLRQLDDPAPLSTTWNVAGTGEIGTSTRPGRPSLVRLLLRLDAGKFTGRADRIDELADKFLQLASRRLVILGEPGTGKTTLAVLLLRELLRRGDLGQPVPVLFPVSDWRPMQHSLEDWLVERLGVDYPMLKAAKFGDDAVRKLVIRNHILPILDGLDEIPNQFQEEAIASINAATTRYESLIVTCRTAEYEAGIVAGNGIRHAVMIVAAPLERRDIGGYLHGCLTGRQKRERAWVATISDLTRHSGTPLLRALATPLDLWLLRKVYLESGADPRPLADRHRFPDAASIKDHFIDHLVPTLFSAAAAHEARVRRGAYPWRPDDASRWLAFIADHLERSATRDFCWWRLHQSLELRPVHRFVVGGGLAVIFGISTSSAAWLAGLPFGVQGLAAVAGLVGAAILGMVFGLASDITASPAYTDMRLLPRRINSLVRDLGRFMLAWLSLGLIAGLALTLAGRLDAGIPGLLVIGLLFGFIHGLMVWVATPVAEHRMQSPANSLRGDAQLAIVRTVVFAAGGGCVVGLLAWAAGVLTIPIILVATGCFAVALFFGPPPKVASSVYAATVLFLFVRGRAPFRLMVFMREAHRLGILRQVGPIYQFRHARIQDRLAQAYRQAGR